MSIELEEDELAIQHLLGVQFRRIRSKHSSAFS